MCEYDLWEIENSFFEKGFESICGIDEAGRGPLAGPVYAAAVILPPGCEIEGLDDSKKLSEKRREELFDIICEKAVAYGVGTADEKEIDEINILQATFLAMRRAFEDMGVPVQLALVDGNREPPLDGPELQCIVGGDGKSASIAAASIIAKVLRDRFMLEMAEKYPEYAFENNKGYGTKAHREAIRKFGPCPIHRRSFLKKL